MQARFRIIIKYGQHDGLALKLIPYCCTVFKNSFFFFKLYHNNWCIALETILNTGAYTVQIIFIGPEGLEVGNGRRFQEHHQAVQYETGRFMLNSCFRKIT